jgi:hypothetical protein
MSIHNPTTFNFQRRHIIMPHFKIALIIASVFFLNSCANYGTQVSVIDPAKVKICQRNQDGSVATVLPGGSDSANVSFYSTSPAPDRPDVADIGGINVRAARSPSKEVKIQCSECETKYMILITADGRLAESEDDADQYNKSLDSLKKQFSELTQEYKFVIASGSSSGMNTITVWNNYLTPVLSTSWDNVKEIRSTRVPDRGWGLLLIPGVILTGVGVGFKTFSPSLGNAFLVPGIAFDALGFYHLCWPKTHSVVYRAASSGM